MKRWPALLWLLLGACAQGQGRLDVLRADDSAAGFSQALTPPVFEFPRDHGPHPQFRHEWWYLTGHLKDHNGERFGFELTFFRYALAPLSGATAQGSPWRTRQIYLAHFAVSDLARRDFHFEQRQSREALGLSGAQPDAKRIWVEDWSLAQSATGWTLHAVSATHALDLRLQPLSPPIPNGDGGLSRKSAQAGAASYYYSVPRLAVSGRLVRQGINLEVDGTAWLDREWGSGALAPDQVGWDWFALQLDDGSALMFYALRRRDGSRDPYSAGTWVDPQGHVRYLRSQDLRIEVLDHWVSPRGGRYPAGWRLRCDSLALDLTLQPQLPDQELLMRPRYWEGVVGVSGRRDGRASGGRGYVELVGYDTTE